jgi:hypothetical protein
MVAGSAGGPKTGRTSFSVKLGRDPAAPGYNWHETERYFDDLDEC